MSKEEITKKLISVNQMITLLIQATDNTNLGTDKEPNLWARNAGKAVLSYRNHLWNQLEDLNEK